MTADIITSEPRSLLDLELLKKTLASRIVLLNEALNVISKEEKANSKRGEVFNLLLVEVQAIKDYGSFLEMSEKLSEFDIDSILSDEDKSKMYDIEAKVNAHKLWFMKFNKQVLDSYSRINDRAMRLKDDDEIRSIPLSQLHKLMRLSDRTIDADFEEVNKDSIQR